MKKLFSLACRGYEKLLERETLKKPLPEHVAIIMDGNRRYAKKVGIPWNAGHIYGAEIIEKVIEWCFELGVKQLTIYAFSVENFRRTEEEKKKLFELIKHEFEKIRKDERIHKEEVKVKIIGNLELLHASLKEVIRKAEQSTERYKKFMLYIAMAYSGRREIVDAARIIGKKVKRGELNVEDIDEEEISKHLYISGSEGDGNEYESGSSLAKSDVDLIIRTGGERRLSNFIPWQALGNECTAYFCAPFWPEFRRIDLLRAIRTYQQRVEERRQHSILKRLKLTKWNSFLEKGGD